MDSNSFGALKDDEIDRLVACGQTVHYAQGRTIFQKGEPGDELMIVIAGQIKFSTVSADGKEAILSVIEPCQSFGEIALFGGKPRSVDAIAVAPTGLAVLQRGEVMALVRGTPRSRFGSWACCVPSCGGRPNCSRIN
jgi:CRP-like cAMP-binding protein